MKDKLLVDMDDVIADLCTSWFSNWELISGEKLNPQIITEWDVSTYSKYGDKVYDVFKQPGFFENLPVVEGSKDALEYLRRKYDIIIVTTPPLTAPSPLKEKNVWLDKHFPWIKYRVFTANKELVYGDVAIDDSPSKLKAYHKAQPDMMTICYDRPHNKNALADYRVKNWNQVLDILI